MYSNCNFLSAFAKQKEYYCKTTEAIETLWWFTEKKLFANKVLINFLQFWNKLKILIRMIIPDQLSKHFEASQLKFVINYSKRMPNKNCINKIERLYQIKTRSHQEEILRPYRNKMDPDTILWIRPKIKLSSDKRQSGCTWFNRSSHSFSVREGGDCDHASMMSEATISFLISLA